MAIMIRFTKAKKKPVKPKQPKTSTDVLAKLNDYLNQTEPETMRFLVGALEGMQNEVSYKELRQAYLSGGLTFAQFTDWQHRYSKLVTDVLLKKWMEAAEQAAEAEKNKFPKFNYNPAQSSAMEWLEAHAAELVTNMARDQMDAINAMVRHFSGYTAITPDEAAIQIRACIGLTKPQALANVRYREAFAAAYMKQHPKTKMEVVERKARAAAAKYAGRQHRYRAMCIARTELAFGYNAGAYGATKDAQKQGYIGECKKKWLTAFDERVCPICSAMDGELADMDEKFTNGSLLPPGHPQCRCAVAYEEEALPQPAPMATANVQIPPDVPIPQGMTYKGPVNLGGTGEMYVYQDATGKEWLFKPAQDKNSHSVVEFRAYIQEAGYKVQGIIDPDSTVKVGTGTLNGQFGAFQERLNTNPLSLKSWQHGYSMTDSDIQNSGYLPQIQREHVTDWLLGNFDSHGGNFVLRDDGKIIGIDKEQAFKYIRDKKSHVMDYDYHPNIMYGETEPIYNTIFRKYARKELDLDLNESLQYIQRIEQIPDDEYREIFRNYAESLFGKGQKAETLLDSIVERKATLRETYRDFFSRLETERQGKQVTFKFADEIGGKPKATKPRKPRAPRKPKKRVAGYEVSEVLDDMSVLPKTQYGVAIKADGKMLEGMEMAGRRVVIDGQDYFEVTGKLTENAWIDAVNSARQNGRSRAFDFLELDRNGEYSFRNISFSIDGVEISDINQNTFELYGDIARKEQYSFDGFFRARIKATGDTASDRKALEQIFDRAGIKKALVNSTDVDELSLKKARLAWQIDPKAVSKLNAYPVDDSPGNPRWQKINDILQQHGITDSRVNAMEWKEVFPGHVTLIDKQAVKEYKKAGMTHVWSGVTSKDSVVAILKSDGLACTNYRFTSGTGIHGASSDEDMQTGGASNVFTRMGAKVDTPYRRASVAGGAYRFIMTPDVAGRTDWYAYNGDYFGAAKGWDFSRRSSATDFANEVVKHYNPSNEIMFRGGIPTSEFVGISCETSWMRTELLDALRAEGINQINGIDIEDFVHVSTMPKEDSELGKKGLKYYNKKTP